MASSVMVSVRVRATPQRAFDAFVHEIGAWWRPNDLFAFRPGRAGRLSFEPGQDGRLVERYEDGSEFEIGRIRVWEPPHRLVFGWRQASFTAEQDTEVHVTFRPSGDETRVTVEHFGWDSIPQEHAARHGFPLGVFLQRHAEWWQQMLGVVAGETVRDQ